MTATVHLLGTGAAYSDAGRTTTMICVTNGASALVIDCGGDVVSRMQLADVSLATIQALFLTHEHIDHVGGFPLLYKKLWLYGRRSPLPVYGLPEAIIQAARCFATFDTRAFKNLPPIRWRTIEPDTARAVYRDEYWEVSAAYGNHGVSSVGLRVTSLQTGGILTYTSDTSPSDAITRLASGSDLLLHEATGPLPGHSTVLQAAVTARESQAGKLVLVHLPPHVPEKDLQTARAIFAPTEIGEELSTYAL